MHFNLSDEQKLIRNAVDKFIRNDYSFDARKKVLALENGFSPSTGASSPTWAGWVSLLRRPGRSRWRHRRHRAGDGSLW